MAVDAEGVGGEADLVDEQVCVVAGPVGGLGVVASGGVQVVGQTVGDAVGAAQEPVEHVEELGDAGELGGVDLDRGLLGAVERVVAQTGRLLVGMLGNARNWLGGLNIH